MTTTPQMQPATPPTPAATPAEQAVPHTAGDIVHDAVEGDPGVQAVPAMDSLANPRRLLLVHAHPDDETINNGATMAHYASQGAHVTLVTCTRGELGEVIPPELAHLEGDGDALAAHRVGELASAMRALGVRDHRFLGDDAGVRFRDSGMAYDDAGRAIPPPDMTADAFARTEVDDAAAHLVRVLRQVRPQVVVTYDPGGGYGHPDHVHAHRVAMRAVELAADTGFGDDEPWAVSRVFWTAVPESVFRSGLRLLDSSGVTTLDPDGGLPSMVVADEQVTTVIDATDQLEAKTAALRAHGTQVTVAAGAFGLSNGIYQPLIGVEHYRLSSGDHGSPATDLFAALP